jgi:hypothetical protein
MPKTKTPRKPSPQRFLAAIESGNIDLVERLLAQGADLHGAWRESPSVCAVRNGHTDIVVLLIRHALDPREYDDLLFSVAVYWRQQDVLKFLAATVFAPDLWRGKTLLDLQKEADLIDSEHSEQFCRMIWRKHSAPLASRCSTPP